ncbi:hypothetical protein C8T65DRAFT_37401 [Cerioporus squamosus]|nr:hypothetical protein C8T65DRAFT_37401 [Cerioporus squamosus]
MNMGAGFPSASPARLVRSSWQRKLLARRATTSRRTLHASTAVRAEESDSPKPPEDQLTSKIEAALSYFRNQRAADPSAEALVQRLAIKPVKHTIRSLNPKTLSESDYVDISGHTCQLNVARKFSRIPTVIPYRYQPFTPFRPGTAGFFYYTSSPALPQAGEIRFRITGSPRPDSFALGRDLLTSNGLVWRLSLLTMIKGFDEYSPIVAKLLSEGLVTKPTRASCLRLMRDISLLSNTERALHSFYQPFVFDFKNMKPKSLWFLTPHSLDKVSLEEWLTHNGRYALPTNGTVMLCAEPAKTQDDAEGDLIVLRVLSIVRPVVYPRRTARRTPEEGAVGEGGAEEGAAQPRPRQEGPHDVILRAYEGQLLANALGEPIAYRSRGEGWPFTWRTNSEPDGTETE